MYHQSAKKKCVKIGTVAVLLCLVPAVLTGCLGGKKYKIDYGGAKDLYANAKDSYRAGTAVTLYFELIATDTDYSFCLDGESIPFTYDDQKGFVISFTMPEHDVTLLCNTVNSMLPPEVS